MDHFHLWTGKKKDLPVQIYAKDTCMCLSSCITGVGEGTAFHIHNCFHFWFLLQCWRCTVCNITRGFHRSVSLPWRKQILGVVTHSHLLLVFFISTKAQNELAAEHQLGTESQDVIIFHMATILWGFGLNVHFSKKKKSVFWVRVRYVLGWRFGLVEESGQSKDLHGH